MDLSNFLFIVAALARSKRWGDLEGFLVLVQRVLDMQQSADNHALDDILQIVQKSKAKLDSALGK